MEQLKLAIGYRTVAKLRMQTRSKRGSRKKPVSFVLLLVIAAMLLFALAPASTTTVIPDSQLVIGNVTTVCPDVIQAGNTTIDAEPIKSDLNDATAYSGDGLTGTEIKQKIQDFVAASEEPVTADDIVMFVNGDVMGAGADETSFGTEYVFNSAFTSHISVSALDATKFVVAYMDGGNSNYGTAVIGTVTGNTIAYGSEYVFNSANTYQISVSALDATNFVVAYQDIGNLAYGTAIIGAVTGNTIAYGTEYVFNSAFTVGMSVSALDATKFVVTYRDYGNSNNGTAIIGTVAGSTIAYGSENVFNSAYTKYISVSALDATNFVVAYQDSGNSRYGTAVIGTVISSEHPYFRLVKNCELRLYTRLNDLKASI